MVDSQQHGRSKVQVGGGTGPCQDVIRRVLFSESMAWAVQNSVGMILPSLFVLVSPMRFSASCLSMIFYGVTSQALSIDRSVGGRFFAGVLMLGSSLCGGLLGFAVVSLSWLGRGAGQAVFDLLAVGRAEGENLLSSVRISYPNITANEVQGAKNVSILIEEFNQNQVSSVYWILVIILFVIVLTPWVWAKAMKEGMEASIAILCISQLTVLLTFSTLMPLLGQVNFWTLVYGGFLKSLLVVTGGMILCGVLVYVKSAHDEYRHGVGKLILECARLLSHITSFSAHAAHGMLQDKLTLEERQRYHENALKLEKEWRRKKGIKTYISLMQDLFALKGSQASAYFEPALPGLCTQHGADIRLFSRVAARTNNVISDIGGLEYIIFGFFKEANATIGEFQLEMIAVFTSLIAKSTSILASAATVLMDMPLGGPVSGNALSWRPKGKVFWKQERERILKFLSDSKSFLVASSCHGLEDALVDEADPQDFAFKPGGSALVALSTLETLINNIQELEEDIARALEVTEDDSSAQIPDNQKSKNFTLKSCLGTPVAKSILTLLLIGSGILGFKLYFKSIKEMSFALVSALKRDKGIASEGSASGNSSSPQCKDSFMYTQKKAESRILRWNLIYATKFFIGMSVSMAGIILIAWLRNNEDTSIGSALKQAEWFKKWIPSNFAIAVSVCLWAEADATIMKAFLRIFLTTIGGVLGYLAVLNGTLAQNPYWIFFFSLLVNFLFSLTSKYGKDVRYVLFLLVYTYFSVVFCQFTGKCCLAGDVWTFAGRTISTLLGATFAFAVGVLVLPMYVSRVLATREEALLGNDMRFEARLWELAPKVFGIKNSKTPNEDVKPMCAEDFKQVSQEIDDALVQRYALTLQILKDKQDNSLDKWHFLFLELTVVRIPKYIRAVFLKLASMGFFLKLCSYTLKGYRSEKERGNLHDAFLMEMMDPTRELLEIAHKIHAYMSDVLYTDDRNKIETTNVQITATLERMRAHRRKMHKTFMALNLHHQDWDIADLRFAAWYQFFISAIRRLESMAYQMTTDHDLLDRNQYWSWATSWLQQLNSKQEPGRDL